MTLSSALKSVVESGSILYKARGGENNFVKVRANGSDIFMSALVTSYGETDPDVDLAATGENIDGVIYAEADPFEIDLDKDSDDCYDDNKMLIMYIPIPGDELYGTVLTATAITANTWVDCSGGFLTTGTRTAHIGKALQSAAGASNTEYVILYRWTPGLN